MRKNIFRLLPEKIRSEYCRKALNIEELGPEYEFKIATTKEELEAAYKLLHDVYVQKGIMDPDPSGLRCNIYSALPFANVIIAKHLNQVVGTRPDNQNFYRFVYADKSKSIRFPEVKNDFAIQPVMTLELLRYFFVEKTSLFHKLSIE